MPALTDLILAGQRVEQHRPWPRAVVDVEVWNFAIDQLAKRHWSLLALWAEPGTVHMALLDEAARDISLVSLKCPDNTFPSVGQRHPPAIRPERTIHDVYGLEPVSAADPRPWIDHGKWGLRYPLGAKEKMSSEKSTYAFLKAEGDSLHQVPVGPVHAGIIEPGHFRFTAAGETVVRLEQRLGYTHKGVEGLMAGASMERATKIAGRISGDSTIAYAYAFAQAVEAALGTKVPERATWLRALMAELERLANHFGDIGGVCNDAAFSLMNAHCGMLRENVLRAAADVFGHRLMMDRVIPGGVAVDMASGGEEHIHRLVEDIRRRFPRLIALYDNTASIQDRTVGSGIVSATLVKQYAAGGYVGRATARAFDARAAFGYAPYDKLSFDVPVREEGDVNARIWIRIDEVEQSLSLIEQILDRLPDGPIAIPLEAKDKVHEGLALTEGFRGDVFVWVRIGKSGKIERCYLRDPSWFQWPLLEAAIEGNIIADFPLCNKSFNCSYSGVDL